MLEPGSNGSLVMLVDVRDLAVILGEGDSSSCRLYLQPLRNGLLDLGGLQGSLYPTGPQGYVSWGLLLTREVLVGGVDPNGGCTAVGAGVGCRRVGRCHTCPTHRSLGLGGVGVDIVSWERGSPEVCSRDSR